MKILKINLSRSLHLNSLMPLTWYLISILYILPRLVHSLCSNHSVVLILCLCILLTRNSFIIFLVYSICLFSINLSFYTLFIEALFKTISGDHGQGIGIYIGNTLLFDSDVSGIYKRPAIKENINKKNKIKRDLVTHLELCARQSCLVCTHFS